MKLVKRWVWLNLKGFPRTKSSTNHWGGVLQAYSDLIIIKEKKWEGRSGVLLGPDNNINFLKLFMNISLTNDKN